MNIRRFEKKKRAEFEKDKKLKELQEEYGIETPETSKRMFQYSKILTTIICIYTLLVNAVFVCVLVPLSGSIGIADVAMESSASVLKIWDALITFFYCRCFAKILFETKSENEVKAEDVIDSVTEKIKSTLGE